MLRACDAGLRELDAHRATLGSQELRAAASGHGARLAELGTRTVDGLAASHADLAERLFGDVPADRLATFGEVLDETTQRFARLMGEVGQP